MTSATSASQRWIVFSAMTLVNLTRIPVGVALGLLLPDISRELGLGLVEQGWLGGALNLGNVLVSVPVAWVVSRWNARWVLAAAAGAAALLTVGQALASSFPVLLVARLLSGVARDAATPARAMLTRQWFSPREVVLTMGIMIACIGVVEWLTFALTPHLLGFVGGWRNVLLVFGGTGLVATLGWCLIGREGPRREPEARGARRSRLSRCSGGGRRSGWWR